MATLIVGNQRELALDSALGNQIGNCQTLEAVPLGTIMGFEKKWGVQDGVRCESTARFNCHGMTFTGRRSAIDDPQVVAQIIAEDGYVEVNSNELMPGDVVIYYDQGDAAHSGIVVTVPSGPAAMLSATQIYSKWGVYRELVHRLYNCPYAESATIKFFRIRSCS